MPNRLANETSPYLLQHQNNPVDWFPWGEEAFAKARAEDKPIFLSVGYSSCHWCHVMEHESFEDDAVAEALNRDFVCVKVDREERPDVDEAYMVAVQLGSGRGGWPMSVFLTPDRQPFFAGTYFPKDERGGHPGFQDILGQIAQIWKNDRTKVLEIAAQYSEAIAQGLSRDAPPSSDLGQETLDECVRALSSDYDEEHGGFGSAPKFPPHTAIEFLLNYAINEAADEELRQTAADMALSTLEKMALGGIHDHVGGGFHRYSTDGHWLLPHFEKMLYDNALLLGNYARAAALCHGQLPELEVLFSKAEAGIVQWLREEMTSPEGLFYSALDADSEGEEGKFYVWLPSELEEILGADAGAFAATYQFHPSGNFRDEATGEMTGANIPHLLEDVPDKLEAQLAKLKEARNIRVKPGLDDKVLVGWNGLMIGALAEATEVEMAAKAASAILEAEKAHGRLPHLITRGKPAGDAFLEDYAYFADGLIALTGVMSLLQEELPELMGRTAYDWLGEAKRVVAQMVERFYDDEGGGFYSTAEHHEKLFGRSKSAFDQPMPSTNAIAAKCLIELGDPERAEKTLQSMAGWMQRAPVATEALHLALMGFLDGQDEPEAPAEPEDKEVRVFLKDAKLASNRGVVVLDIPAGQHINTANPPARWLVATQLEIEPLKFKVFYPEGADDRYEGRVEIPFEVELPSGSKGEEFEVRVRFQVCTESECKLPAEQRLTGFVSST